MILSFDILKINIFIVEHYNVARGVKIGVGEEADPHKSSF